MRRLVLVLLALLVFAVGLSVSSLTSVAQDAPTAQTYIVQRGDTLFRIALRFGTTLSAITAANPQITNINLIYVGQQITIPTGSGPVPTAPPGPGPTQPPGQGSVYIVVAGDTLGRIAARFGTTVTAIAQANNIVNINLIYVGQRLTIPGGGTGPIPTSVPGPGVTPVPPGPGLSGFQLGGHVFSFAFPDQMRSAGMSWAKRQIEWNRGDGTDAAANAINEARGKGFKILLGIKGFKDQLAGNPAQYYQEFAAYLGNVARLGPDAIEVWNEPNIDREWPAGQISGANYTQMLAAAYQQIKSANSNVVVISGAPAPTGFFGGTCQNAGCDDNVFLSQMRSAGAASFMDCVGLHYNEGILPPTARSGDPRGNSSHYTRYYPTMVETYASVFPSKSLCFTELGYLTGEGLGPLPAGWEWANDTSLQEQAQWLGDAVRLSRQGGRVRLLIVWNVDNTSFGADPQAGFAIIRNNNCTACATLGAAMQ